MYLLYSFLPTAIIPAAVVFFIALYRYRNRAKGYTLVTNNFVEEDTIKLTRDVIEQTDRITLEGSIGPVAVKTASKETASTKSESESCNETSSGKISTSTKCADDFIQFSQNLSTVDSNVPTSSSSYDRVVSFHDPISLSSYDSVHSFHDPISSTYGCDISTQYDPIISAAVRTPSQHAQALYSRTLTPSSSRMSFASSHLGNSFSQSGSVYAVGEVIKSGSFNLKIVDIIGQGGQAVLYRVQDGRSIYAAKVSHFGSTPKDLQYEYDLMSELSHPHIVSVFQEIPRGFLLECLFEDLLSLIGRVESLPPHDRDNIALGIVQAASYLHHSGIAHLDIKPDNVLMTACGIPKLADFGLAMRFRNENGDICYLMDFHGSFEYVPPEMFLLTAPIDMMKSDSWSLGVTFFAMMSGHLPFSCSTEEELLSNQLNGNFWLSGILKLRIKNNRQYSRFMDMIRALCNIDPKARFSASEAISFYWPQNR